MRIYFAHPFATIGTEDEARILAELKKRGEEIHNPFENDKDKEWMKRFRKGEFSLKDAERLVELDLAAIDRSDAVLVWLPTGIYTCGTICEMVYAYYSNIHTIVIHSEGRRVNPWVWYHASALYPTIEDWIAGNLWVSMRVKEIQNAQKGA